MIEIKIDIDDFLSNNMSRFNTTSGEPWELGCREILPFVGRILKP